MLNVKRSRRRFLHLNASALLALGCYFQPGVVRAQEPPKQAPPKPLIGTWKLTSWLTKFDGGDAVQPYGPNPKGRLILTAEGHWFIILTAAGRSEAKTADEKAALLDSMTAYSGKYTVEGDRITVRAEISWNEFYSGPNQIQTRFFTVDGDKLIVRTGQIASAIRQGQKAEGVLMFERER